MDVDDKMMMMLTVMMMMMTTMRSEAQLPLTCQTWPTVRQGRLVGGQPNHHRRLGILILKAIGYAEKQNMQIGLGSQRLGP